MKIDVKVGIKEKKLMNSVHTGEVLAELLLQFLGSVVSLMSSVNLILIDDLL